jgi:glycosidase
MTRRWMDPNGDGDSSDGIDGWRLDVANDVAHFFWREWRKHVKSINPDAYIVGEIWDDASQWLAGDQFDAVMNYPFARAVVRFFIDTGEQKYSASMFDAELTRARASYPQEANYVLQNLIDSHDTDRLLSMIINPNRNYDAANGLRQNKEYNITKPDARARQVQKLIALFQMTYLGAPMIYYGDEAGMWGADDPDDRKPMVWADLVYENERSHPVPGKTRSDDVVKFDQNLFEYYKKLVHIRNQNVALRRGDFKTLLVNDQQGLYAFERRSEENVVVVLLNNSWEQRRATIEFTGKFREQLSGKLFSAKGKLELIVEPKAGMILVRE